MFDEPFHYLFNEFRNKIRFIRKKNICNVGLNFLDTYELAISFIKFNRSNSFQNS